MRRINRFIQLIRTGEHITFIRDEINMNKITIEQIDEFMNLISSMNSSLELKLIIILHNSKKKKLNDKLLNYNNDKVKIINDELEFKNWTRPNVDWKNLFIF